MKRFLPLFLLFFINNHLFAQETYKQQMYPMQMFGPIEISHVPGKVIIHDKIKRENIYRYTFNKKGKDSTLEESRVYTYDERGNIQSMLLKPTSRLASGLLFTYTFNEKGFLQNENVKQTGILSRQPDKYKIEHTATYEYDSSNRLINRYYYNKDTTQLIVLKFEYNDLSQIFKISKKADKGDFTVNFNISYDNTGKFNLFNRMGENGKDIDFSYQYDYGDGGRSESMSLINLKGRHLREEKFYNINHQFSKIINKGDDPGDETLSKFTYNDDGTLSTETRYTNGKATDFFCHFYQK
jgi:hypothetical protein